jgi:hypothetical protein
MTASSLSTSCPVPHGFERLSAGRLASRLRKVRGRCQGCSVGLYAVAALLLLAVLLAPEQPLAQASICERHNGPAACRVW